jgi:hypothetical protein
MMARNRNVPFKGRIQKRKTYHLQIITFGLQRAAGPYRRAKTGCEQTQQEARKGSSREFPLNSEFRVYREPLHTGLRALPCYAFGGQH